MIGLFFRMFPHAGHLLAFLPFLAIAFFSMLGIVFTVAELLLRLGVL